MRASTRSPAMRASACSSCNGSSPGNSVLYKDACSDGLALFWMDSVNEAAKSGEAPSSISCPCRTLLIVASTKGAITGTLKLEDTAAAAF